MKNIATLFNIIVILVVVVSGIAGYFILSNLPSTPIQSNNTPVVNKVEANWQFIDAGSFTLSLPLEWRFNKLQGIDSYVGEFVGDGAKLNFDYGQYSDPLAEDNNSDHIVTYEAIDGYKAKIVVPKVMGTGTTGVYFADLGGGIQKMSFQISGRDLIKPQQETALKIFHTIKIVK